MDSWPGTPLRGLLLFLASMLSSAGPRRRLLRSLRHSLSYRSSLPGGVEDRVAYWLSRDAENRFLEEVEGERAVAWVRRQNDRTLQALGDPSESPLFAKVLAILESSDRIAHVERVGDLYYNFWKDGGRPRGVWRRTTLESYRSASPEWETVLDVDELCGAEGESWVWGGHRPLRPRDLSEQPRRTLVFLSKGGSDAKIVREFDLERKVFVEDGFSLPRPAKSRVSWLSPDVLLVGTDLEGVKEAPASSLTSSGYPRLVCEWRRGTPLSEAKVVFEGEPNDVAVSGFLSRHRGVGLQWRRRSLTFFTSKLWVCAEDEEGPWREVPVPEDAEVEQFADQLLITLRSAWTVGGEVFPGGAVLAVHTESLLAHQSPRFSVLFRPAPRVSLDGLVTTLNFVVISTLENVKNRLLFWRFENESEQSRWILEGTESSAAIRGVSMTADDSERNDFVWFTRSSFLSPTSLSLMDVSRGANAVDEAELLKQLPRQFDASKMEELQSFAISKDGELVPYFVVRSKEAPRGVKTPCLLYGYGGFEIALTPNYLGAFGYAWLQAGFTYVMANIRGGGEFGPTWHKAALRENRNKAYEDFVAVAEDLISSNLATSSNLAIRGGSNGGLLVGNMFVQRPDLFKAVVCQVPLLDMHRYNKLLAGASWVAEYGDPDTDDWGFLKKYSAYHNIDPKGNTLHPKLLLTTSMKDDRVHPYHARAFARRLQELGLQDIFYYENIEGGHSGAADSKQQAYVLTLYINFLKQAIC